MRRSAPFLIAALFLAVPALAVPEGANAAPPQIGSAWTVGVSSSSAGLRAELNPGGLVTSYRFEYLNESAYEANLATGHEAFAGALNAPAGTEPTTSAGSAFLTVALSVSSLSPDTAYRYRLLAVNGSGSAVGEAHRFATQPFGGEPLLGDGRAWEMVSPSDKGGGEVPGPGGSFGGGLIEAAAQGSALTFSSPVSFAGAVGAPPVSQYLATRTAAGWSTANVSAAGEAGAYGPAPDGAPYRLFSPGLSLALMAEGRRCPEEQSCGEGYSLRAGDGSPLALSPEAADLRLAGASPAADQAVLATCKALTADATEAPLGDGCDPAKPNLYRWSASGIELLNLLPGQAQGTAGAALAAPLGAVSEGAERVYFTLGGNLYLRDGSETEQVDSAAGGGGTFQAASASGQVAYYTAAGHLYRYDAGTDQSTDLTSGGGIVGVLGASESDAYVYYQDAAALRLWHEGAVTTIAAGAQAASASDYPAATATVRLSPDGTRLAFLSAQSLTGYDNRDRSTGQPHTELYLYDADAETLACISCMPSGERPLGDSTIPGTEANGSSDLYRPRALTDGGRRLFFDSPDALSFADVDRKPDVYEWEQAGTGSCTKAGGCLSLVSKGRSSEGSAFLDASGDGADAFFLTADPLVGADEGEDLDAYDAREGGGFPEPSKPIECLGDACQFLPSEPEDDQPGTLVASAGNPPVRFEAEKKALVCRKGKVRREGRCVPKRRHARHHQGHRGRSSTGSPR
jgi:hypothetical protein